MAATNSFHIVDYAIFALILLVSLSIGLYHACTGGKQRTTKEFLMGNRQMKTIPVTLSIFVSFVSGILVLGTPAEMYTRGTQLFMRTLGYCVACVLSSILFVPLFFNLNVTSSFEYLDQRFQSKFVKLIGTVSMLIGNLFYMGIVIYTPATALEAVTGFPLWSSIIATGLVTTLSTTLGGLKAVIWTDVFQAVIMLVGIVVILVRGILAVGGMEKVWNISVEGGRISFFDFDFNPTVRLTFWSTVIGGMFSTLGIFGIGQTSVQRYCSLPTLRQAKRSIYLNIPFLIVMNVLISMLGLVIYAYYAAMKCDPLRNKDIKYSDQLVPYFVINAVNYPGLPGVFLAVLFCGSLSSLSSSLNSAAAVTWQDILSGCAKHYSEFQKTLMTKFLVVMYGLLAILIAYLTPFIGGHVLQASLSFSGATIGPSLGMFLLGAVFPFANKWGALSGCILSSIFSLWLAIGTFVMKPHYATLLTSVAGCNSSSLATTSPWNVSSYSESSDWSWTADAVRSYLTLSPDMDPSTTAAPTVSITDWIFVNNPMYKLSFLWYSMIGCLMTIFIGIVVSLMTFSRKQRPVDPLLYIPIFDRLCCCLPRTVRRQLTFAGFFVSDTDIDSNSTQTDSKLFEKSDIESASVTLLSTNHLDNSSLLQDSQLDNTDISVDARVVIATTDFDANSLVAKRNGRHTVIPDETRL